MKTIAIIIPYFGKWPEWIDVFFHSCEQNKTIDFIFFTDCEIKNNLNNNLKFIPISFDRYNEEVSKKLKINFKPKNAYKLCDLKPFYGYIHKDLLENYDFYGFGDLDLFWGDIRSFYTDDILNNYDVVSTHDDRISGHLNLFRNNETNIQIPFKIKDWKKKLEEKKMVTITENYLTRVYFPMFNFNVIVKKILRRIIGRERVIYINNIINKRYKKTSNYKKRRLYFKEQYTTPLTYIYWLDNTLHDEQPDTWFYENGTVTNKRDIGKNFIYIHFMNFKDGKYRKDGKKIWHTGFYKVKNEDINKRICINKEGIFQQ